MSDIIPWLRAFLAARGLSKPDRRMLFAYRATAQEYAALRGLLRSRLQALAGARWRPETSSECACLVLYASEWWRREYAGGAWHWHTLLESLYSPYELPPPDRNEAVERGLRAWGHRPGDEGKRFFGAIVAQGGLPLRLVARGAGVLSRLLRMGVRQAQQFRWDAAQLEAMFAAEDGCLVSHLRKPEIHSLLAEMVLTALALRTEHGLAGMEHPVQRLDERERGWRERFPLAVDDEAAERLLTELVGEAAREVQARAEDAYPVAVTRLLERDAEGAWRLRMKATLPTAVSLDTLTQAVNLQPEQLPHVFALELAGAAQRLPLGPGRRMVGQEVVRLSGTSRLLRDEAALGEWLLVLRATGQDLGSPAPLPGGEALDTELPWVFACGEEDDEGVAELAAVGGCRLGAPRCLVALPEGFALRPAQAGSRVVPRGVLQGLEATRQVLELCGTGLAEGPAGDFRIHAGAAAAPAEQFLWRGTRMEGQTRPLAAWRGVPTLWRTDAEGRPVRVDVRDIEWTAARPGGARLSPAELSRHRGPVDAWLCRDGVRQRRFRMALAGADASIGFESGASDCEGAITLHGWGLASVTAPQDLADAVTVAGGEVRIELRAAAQRPPAQVELALAWAGSPLALWLTLPFPAAGGRFMGPDGLPLSANATVSMRQLRGVAVQAVDLNPRSPASFTLSVDAPAVARNRHPGLDLPVPIEQGFGALRLLEIEDRLLALMGCSDELDARLTLRLLRGSACVAQLHLTRYDHGLERSGPALTLSDTDLAALDVQTLRGVRLSALPMLRTDVAERELAQACCGEVPAGRWDLSALSIEHGPWLVYPAQGSTLQLRPTLFPGFTIGLPPAKAEPPCALSQAMAPAEPKARMAGITAVVAAMGADLSHPSWHLVARQHQRLGHLPLSTLDCWRAIGRDPAASLAAVLKAGADVAALMRDMRVELGVMWELLPLPLLQCALRQLLQDWAAQTGLDSSDPLVRGVVEGLVRRLGEAEPVLAELVDLALFQEGFMHTERLAVLQRRLNANPRKLLEQLLQGPGSELQQLLLHRHAQDRLWPQTHGELLTWLGTRVRAVAPSWTEPLQQWRWLPGLDTPTHLVEAVNAPLMAGLLSQLDGDAAGWQTAGMRLAQLRQLRHFEPAWFEAALALGRTLALQRLLQSAPATAIAPASRQVQPVAKPSAPVPVPVARPAAHAVPVPAAPRPASVNPQTPAPAPMPTQVYTRSRAAVPSPAPAAASSAPVGPSYAAVRRVPRTDVKR